MIFKSGLNYGGSNSSDKKREWAEISGIDNYNNSSSTALDNGFLTTYSITAPDEDIAEWVGITYSLYIKGETFSDLLNVNSSKYDDENQKKIDFLLAKKFMIASQR